MQYSRRRLAASVSFTALVAAVGAFAVPLQVNAQTPVLAKAKPARLNYKETRLKNGLKVITLEDHSAPVVTVQVWYRVGSKDEPQGQSGFAHLFEHLMFKGSANVGPEQHARYVESLGASYNAGTSFDHTAYFETVPSNALERMLFLEADRMTSLRVDEANLKSERDVVKEEYRLRVANAPYGNLLTDVLKQTYPVGHPYNHATIGSIPDLDAATLAQVRAFHDQYYRPDNATLVLVGDFKTGDTLKMVEKYFGAVPKSPTGKFDRIPAAPAFQAAETRQTYYDQKAPLPMVGMAYRVPAPTDPDAPVFEVISQILSTGQSSRLYRSLVRDKQVAATAAGINLDLQLGGMYLFFGVANAGKSPGAVEAALAEEVERLRNTPVSEAELAKAKNQALTGEVFGLVSTEAKANALGEADTVEGDAGEVNKAYEKLTKVTAADVQRVAKKYFASDQRNVFYVLPASMNPANTPAKTGAANTTPALKEVK